MQDKISGIQIRAARCYLDWTREDLAERSGISAATIKNLETAVFNPRAGTVTKLIDVFDKQGLVLADEGVKRKATGLVPNPLLDAGK